MCIRFLSGMEYKFEIDIKMLFVKVYVLICMYQDHVMCEETVWM